MGRGLVICTCLLLSFCSSGGNARSHCRWRCRSGRTWSMCSVSSHSKFPCFKANLMRKSSFKSTRVWRRVSQTDEDLKSRLVSSFSFLFFKVAIFSREFFFSWCSKRKIGIISIHKILESTKKKVFLFEYLLCTNWFFVFRLLYKFTSVVYTIKKKKLFVQNEFKTFDSGKDLDLDLFVSKSSFSLVSVLLLSSLYKRFAFGGEFWGGRCTWGCGFMIRTIWGLAFFFNRPCAFGFNFLIFWNKPESFCFSKTEFLSIGFIALATGVGNGSSTTGVWMSFLDCLSSPKMVFNSLEASLYWESCLLLDHTWSWRQRNSTTHVLAFLLLVVCKRKMLPNQNQLFVGFQKKTDSSPYKIPVVVTFSYRLRLFNSCQVWRLLNS